MKAKSLLLIGVILVGSLLVSCGGSTTPPDSGGNESNLEINETSTSTDTVAEPIFINNCGNPASVEQVSEHSQTIAVEGGAELGVSTGVVRGSVEGKYISTKGTTKSQKVVAAPNTNMKFVLLWTEQIKEGTVTASGYSGQATYRVSVPISVEQASAEDLGCPNNNSSEPSTPTPKALPITVPQVSPDTPPGSTLQVGQSWRQNGLVLALAEVELLTQPDWGTCYIGLRFYLENFSSTSRVVTVRHSQFSITDNFGRTDIQHGISSYSYPCPSTSEQESFSQEVGIGERFPERGYWYVGIGVDITNPSVEYVLITVNDLSEINGATWKIQINH